MARRVIAVGVLLVFLAGCCSHVPGNRGPLDLEEANSTLRGRQATITTTDGSRFEATDVRVTPESVSWGRRTRVERESMPTSDVASIEVSWRGLGAVLGFLVGGSSFGALALAAYWADPDEPYAAVGASVLAIVGAIIGVPTGAAVACRTYDLTTLHEQATHEPGIGDASAVDPEPATPGRLPLRPTPTN